jgi:hypothetical protein
VTREQYIAFLIATEGNFTCTYLADHLDGQSGNSHDAISDFLAHDKVTPRHLWELVKDRLQDSAQAFLIVDDSVQDKNHSRRIELVHKQFSGNVHRVLRGIGVVNLLHSDGKQFWPIDYRIHDPDGDGKSKHDHFREMLVRAKTDKQLKARYVLFDAWYTSAESLKLIHRLDMIFVAPLKGNRKVSLSKESGYQAIDSLSWTAEQLRLGISVKLKELPFRVLLFRVVSRDGDSERVDWFITNRLPGSVEAGVVEGENHIRWQIEQLHRELKQLVGTERCQCRKARSQRNHLGLCYQAWVALKVAAQQVGKSLYALQRSLFDDYLTAQMRNPRIPAIR